MGFRAVEWVGGVDGHMKLIDQTLLPTEYVHIKIETVESAWEAIRSLRVRGAPAIGVAAGYAMVLACQGCASVSQMQESLVRTGAYLKTSRPTAVNLAWAVDRILLFFEGLDFAAAPGELCGLVLEESQKILEEDIAMCRAIGEHGARLVRDGDGILTHCNAGGLATGAYGTALSVIYTAAAARNDIRVFADETRPLLQGSRLTAWELMEAGVDVTVICDSMAAWVMKQGKVDLVVTGADRIAANGDAANKIGTYGVALAAKAHGIDFYVAAPYSTFDFEIGSGDEIPIEERDRQEVVNGFGRATAPEAVKVYNPAFDVTPGELIAGIITEHGILRPSYMESISAYRKKVCSPESD